VTTDGSNLVLVVAPTGRDAEMICRQLGAAGLRCFACEDIAELCGKIDDGVGAIVITEEALSMETIHQLTVALSAQPAWSEIPLIVLTGASSLETKPRAFDMLGRRTNVTLVDRPVRIKSLISAAQSALRARDRQYEVRDLMSQLEERIRERDRFLAVLGHELRNPLGAILLASQMTGDDGRLDREHAELIERQARHLTRLVNDLLDLSRVAAGKIVLKRQNVDLRAITAQSIRVMQPAAERQDIELNLVQPEEPLMIHADPVRVEQIVTNILSNAIKYTPEEGHVTVVVSKDDKNALIRVTDDGVGIAPERIGGIFELFAQAENAIGRAEGGMGIGLALVRNLVQLHEGSVEAKSDGVGHGSEFVVQLPLATEESKAEAITRAPSVTAGELQSVGRRIVIVEDNADVRELLALKLKRLGHSVDAAPDGVEGLQRLVDVKPDLALIDLGLPGIDGYEVAKKAREQLGQGIVLVAVSGFGQPEDKRRALESGFDDHITKPADVKDIESLLLKFPSKNTPEVRRAPA
jgi:signal transduction histidine kinase/ActR/RegA family two-component response regulator